MPERRAEQLRRGNGSASNTAASLLGGLSSLAGRSFSTSGDAIEAILKLIADQLGMRTTHLSHISEEDNLQSVVAAFNAPDGCAVMAGSEIDLEDTYCRTVAAMVDPEPLIIEDTKTDPRFAGSRAARAFPNIGSYLGVPIWLSDGTFYGTLCAIDPEPHRLTPEGAELVTVLARFCATEIERDLEAERRHAVEREATLIQADRERSQAQTLAVLDAASDAMVLVDPNREFRVVNRRFAEMFGVESSAVIGRKFEELAPEVERTFEDAAGFAQIVAGSAADPERVLSTAVTQRFPVKRELQMLSTPVHGAGEGHLGRLYAFRDVSHEREVDRLKTEFVSLVSHELRTPLTSIKGFVDLLLEFEVERLSADQLEFLTIVQSNVDRLVAIINDLLDISRIESGNLNLEWSEFDLRQAITEVANSFQPQLIAKRQTLSLDLPRSLPYVLADQARVLQILTNLVSNAHKYTPEGGSITIAARADERFLAIDVTDTGIGMTAEDLERLFTRFFRARNRATQEVRGTGLGMTITRSLVEAQGGQIDVSSRPGDGTTFHFTLLAAAGEQRPVAAQMPWSLGSGGRRVLVVEDDPDNADLIQRYLEHGGYEVLHAASGEDAILLVQEEHLDLISLDMTLPDLDGFTVLERLRATLGPSGVPPVLVLSVLPNDARANQLGIAGHLIKPIDEATLLGVIDEILNGPPAPEISHVPATTKTGGRVG